MSGSGINTIKVTLRRSLLLLVLLSVATSPLPNVTRAQTQSDNQSKSDQKLFHVERVPVVGGAELVTIKAQLDQTESNGSTEEWIPLVSVLADTVGDAKTDNDPSALYSGPHLHATDVLATSLRCGSVSLYAHR